MYHYIFYQSKLVPRWLSIWGLGAVTLVLASGLLNMFGGPSLSTISDLLNLPNFVNELMNEVMVVLDSLPPRYREAMFKDRMQLGDLMVVGLNVAVRYPDVLRVTFEKLGFGGTIGMMKNLLGWAVSPVR